MESFIIKLGRANIQEYAQTLEKLIESSNTEVEATLEHLKRLLKAYETLLYHLEFTSEVLRSDLKDDITALKQKFNLQAEDYTSLESREAIDPKVLQHLIQFLNRFVIASKARFDKNLKDVDGQGQKYNENETSIAWVLILVSLSLLKNC